MKINRKLKITLAAVSGIFLLLFIILIVHIATARPVENATLQVSRIDFEQPFDLAGAQQVKKDIATIPGVKSDILVKGNVVVYFHDNRVADSKKIYDQLMAKGNYTAKRFTVPKQLASQSVCPVMNHNGFYYKFSKSVQHFFN